MLAVLVVALLAFAATRWFGTEWTQRLAVELRLDDQPLRDEVVVVLQHRGGESSERAVDGVAEFNVPAGLRRVEAVRVEDDRFRVASRGPYRLAPGEPLRIKVEPLGELDPLRPDELPDPRALFGPDMPTWAKVQAERPALAPRQIVLEYRNATSYSFQLLVLDCSRYYASRTPGAGWKAFPLPPGTGSTYSRFGPGSGLFCFLLRDRNGKYVPLGCLNLYNQRKHRLIVTGTAPDFRMSHTSEP